MRKLVPLVVALLLALPGPALAFNGFATFTEAGDAGSLALLALGALALAFVRKRPA